jgi:hypothetical protein
LTASSIVMMPGSCSTSMPTPFTVPPLTSASKSALKRSRLLRTAAKPCGWPCAASAEPRARRCESICISVAVATCADCCVAMRPSSHHRRPATRRNSTSSPPSTCSCLSIGSPPMIGSLRGAAALACAVRSCSMMDTEASGS